MSMLKVFVRNLLVLSLVFTHCYQQESLEEKRDRDETIFINSFKEELRSGPDISFVNRTNEIDENDSKLDVVLGRLVQLQSQVDLLQTNVETICAPDNFLGKKPVVLTVIEKEQCEQVSQIGMKYDISNCGEGTSDKKSFFYVNGTKPMPREGDHFCKVLSPLRIPEKQFSVKVQLYNVVSLFGTYYGFPGLAFNIENEKNFDFVVIRLHQKRGCFQTGFVQNGEISYIGSKSGSCKEEHPQGRTWFTVEVRVSDSEATLFVNGLQATIYQPHFPPIGRGGVILKLGEKNIIHFRDLTVTPFYDRFFDIFNCRSYLRISAHYYRLDSAAGRWPESGFCKAIGNFQVNSSDYAISVHLFNQRGPRGGHQSGILGMMYNVVDENNFDFVYFKPEYESGCYFTGYVENNRVQWANSKIGSCPGGPFRGGVWNEITIYVRGKDAMIHLDGRHVVSTASHFENRPVGGVIVSNQNAGNVISFKDFHIRTIEPGLFTFHGCHHKTRVSSGYYILDAKHGRWPQNSFCRAFSKQALPGENYRISAELFITEVINDELVKKFFGLAFNIKDAANYDFVILRPSASPCYYVGFVMDDKVNFISSMEGACPGGPPKKGAWFKMSVTIRKSIAVVDLDEKHLVTITPKFPNHPQGGVLVSNGNRNALTFRYFQATVIQPLEFELSRCGPKTNFMNGTFLLDAAQPYWPINLFCAALYGKTLQTKYRKYTVEAMLQNVNSYAGVYLGQPGLIYNALDANTFEYAYIRLHNKKYCFQFGSVIRGRIRETRKNSGSCGAMRPEKGNWFRLTIKIKDREVHLYIDNVLLTKYHAAFPMKPRGGVVVPNGFKNVIMFRGFRLF